jgi:hypothetical protein
MRMSYTSLFLFLCGWLVLAFGESTRTFFWEMYRKRGIAAVVDLFEERSPDPKDAKRIRRAGTLTAVGYGFVFAAVFAWVKGWP